MRLAFSPADEAFRNEVRTFVATKLPLWLKKKVDSALSAMIT
jgi:hypothetical protein